MNTIFIHTNNKQFLGAILAEYAITRSLKESGSVRVQIINVDELPEFKAFAGSTYLRKGRMVTYTKEDLQSFTLSRFMAPEYMGYTGRAVVIDPDIFATGDVSDVFDIDLNGNALAACHKKDAWDSSVMLMDCAQLKHWKISDMLERLRLHEVDYDTIMTLKSERAVQELSRVWNNLDLLTTDTRFLHTTNRLTQPWKTGLPIDFTRNPMPKLFGIIPREPIHAIMGKYPTTYQQHPDKKIEDFFIQLSRDALADGAVTRTRVEEEIRAGHVRKDLLELIG